MVDFALVGALVAAVALALLQLALGLHVRNVLIDAAGEGARRAALVGGTTAEAEARVRALAGAALSGDCVQAVQVRRTRTGGLAVVEVRVLAWLLVLGKYRFYVDQRAIIPRSHIAELLRSEGVV